MVTGATAAGTEQQDLLPGVSVAQEVDLTPHGPVAYTVITLPAPDASSLASLGPVLPGGTLTSPSESVPQIEQDLAPTAFSIGVDGDFANTAGTLPNGIVVSGGVLEHTPNSARSSIGFESNGSMVVARIAFAGTWQGTGQRRPLTGVNQQPGSSQTVLFTPAWGATAPAVANGAVAVLDPFPPVSVGAATLAGTVASAGDASAPTSIPPDGAVLVSTGTEAAKLTAEAQSGGSVSVRLTLPSAWSGVASALGGGPLLVKAGKAVFDTSESFDPGELGSRDARAAVGQLANGDVLLVTVDGGQPGESVGMTNYELAQLLVRLGAVTAAGLQYGVAATAAFDGQLLDRPESGAAKPVREALLYEYQGVYTPPPSAPVLTKATAAGGETLTYELVRPSSVTATVIDPNGTVTQVDAGQRNPGTYHFPFPVGGAEGTWHWHVTATDDLGRQSSDDVTFTYDLTLSGLQVPKSAGSSGLRVAFTLSRPATVTLQLDTAGGTVIDTGTPTQLGAGPQALTWTGETSTGTNAPRGSYVVHVLATSSIGTSDASAAFSWAG